MNYQDPFVEFHTLHPEVYDLLVRLARQAQAAGHDRIGIGMLYEMARWQTLVGSSGATYRLNNNYKPRYARLIATNEPALAPLFEMRELRS